MTLCNENLSSSNKIDSIPKALPRKKVNITPTISLQCLYPCRDSAVIFISKISPQQQQGRNLSNAFRAEDGEIARRGQAVQANRFVKRTLNNWPICAQENERYERTNGRRRQERQLQLCGCGHRAATSSIYNNTVDGFIKSERRRGGGGGGGNGIMWGGREGGESEERSQ